MIRWSEQQFTAQRIRERNKRDVGAMQETKFSEAAYFVLVQFAALSTVENHNAEDLLRSLSEGF